MKRVVVAQVMLAVFVAAIIGLGLWVYWATTEPLPQPLPGRNILTGDVKRGDFMIVGAARVAGSGCYGWIYRQITDSKDDLVYYETEFRPPTQSPLPPSSIRRLPIPKYASLGEAHYNVSIQWTCNLLQRLFPVYQHLPELTFNIVE